MRARSSLRGVFGVLLVVVFAAQPVAAAPTEPEAVRWLTTVEAWWGGLLERLGIVDRPEGSAAASAASEGGPDIDPGGLSGGSGGGTDDGPSIDPGGANAGDSGENDDGPGMDPGG